jgi:hypothetical protein
MISQKKIVLLMLLVFLSLIGSSAFAYDSSGYADYILVLAKAFGFTVGYCINPFSWLLAILAAIVGMVLSKPFRNCFSEIIIGFCISIGAYIPIAMADNYHADVHNFDYANVMNASLGGSVFGILASLLFFVVTTRIYKTNSTGNPLRAFISKNKWFPNSKFFIFVFISVVFLSHC